MKLNFGWVISILGKILAELFIIGVSLFLYNIELLPKVILNELGSITLPKSLSMWILIFWVFMGIIYLFLIIVDITQGDTYYKIEMVPIKDFKLDMFSNMFVVSYKSKAFPLYYKKERILKLKEVEVVHIYNLRKQYKRREINWDKNLKKIK